ncbi:major facilitator superfamily transporter [Xylaria bambusicola]|uniref:major facilitator superfamily transporter n=1 Tax=Xylaria bambusicola TaxID=326684 RepID=UPI0020074311|nr:major facilitator superfamily transporter [Xylaria bambusicola]KAI0517802.1 major facilitator superfamily transporter [Xylaria bambusicola]
MATTTKPQPSPTESSSSSVSDYKHVSTDTHVLPTPDETIADEAQCSSEKEWRPSLHEKAIIYTLAITSFIVALDATIVITPLSAIIEDLKGTTTQAFWIGTSYLLANAVTMPVVCAISGVFGRPICLIFSLIAFSVGTVLCAVSKSIGVLLVGRSIQGIGGAGIHSLGLVIQTDIVPLRWRPKWYGVTLGAWALGLAIGPIIGGAVVHGTTWRWIFYLMFPFLGFGLIAVPYLLTLKPREATFTEKLARIDWVGSFIFTGSATSFLIAISWGGSQFEWNSVQTLAPLIIGLLGLLATLVYEKLWAKEPFLRHSLYHNTSSTVGYACGCIQGMVMYGFLYYGPFFFQSVKEFSPLNTGVTLLPATLTVTTAGIVCGRLVTRYNNYRWAICVGWFVASLGAGLFLIWPRNNSAAVWVVTYLIVGTGQGAILNAQNFATQAMCKKGDEAAAAAMYAFIRQFGMSLGVAIGGTAFQNVMALKLRWLGLPVEIAKQSESYISVLHAMPAGDYKNKVLDAYKYGFTGLFAFYLGISVVALVISTLFIENVDLTREIESDHQLDDRRWEKQRK